MTVSDPVLIGLIGFIGVGFASSVGALVALRRGSQDRESTWVRSLTDEVSSVRKAYGSCEERMDAMGLKIQQLQEDILTCIKARNDMSSQVADLTREVADLRRRV